MSCKGLKIACLLYAYTISILTALAILSNGVLIFAIWSTGTLFPYIILHYITLLLLSFGINVGLAAIMGQHLKVVKGVKNDNTDILKKFTKHGHTLPSLLVAHSIYCFCKGQVSIGAFFLGFGLLIAPLNFLVYTYYLCLLKNRNSTNYIPA